LLAEVASAAALLVTLTATVCAQSSSDFFNNVDPLFSGVLAHPGNLENTIPYGATAAAHGDIESAISTYEQLRFYNPKLGATRYQLEARWNISAASSAIRARLRSRRPRP
jgi:hypothetical protein